MWTGSLYAIAQSHGADAVAGPLTPGWRDANYTIHALRTGSGRILPSRHAIDNRRGNSQTG